MESAAVTSTPSPARRAAARLRAVPATAWAALALTALGAVYLAIFVAYPTIATYDSIYHLVWGRELLDLTKPVLDAYRAPTEHPLMLAFGGGLSLLGDRADRVWIALTLVSLLVLVWGVYRLGRVTFGPLVGGVAGLLLAINYDLFFLAIRGFIDVPFLALVAWAAVLEAERARRGWPVLALLAIAGLLRPEAWLLAGLYFLWVAWPASWRRRAAYAALAAIGPVVWALTDLALAGNPLFSLQYTGDVAATLERNKPLSEVPEALVHHLRSFVGLPVLLAAVLGAVAALRLGWRRAVMPAVLVVTGIGTYLAVAVAGLSVIPRYLVISELGFVVLAGVALAGWTLLVRGGAARRVWAVGGTAVLAAGVAWAAAERTPWSEIDRDLSFRADSPVLLREILDEPAVRDGLRCGPISLPSDRLVPETRWHLDLGPYRVVARSDRPVARRTTTGVAIFTVDPEATRRHAFWNPSQDPKVIQEVQPGFERVAENEFFAAYVNCP